MKVEFGSSNYGTKADFKNVTGVDTSKCAKKASFKLITQA